MKTVLFDLDGTLLPMDIEDFTKRYIGSIVEFMYKHNRDGKAIANAVYKGVVAMAKNTGAQTNEEAFWEAFKEETGIEQREIEDDFMTYYETVFDCVDTGEKNFNMIEAVKVLKEKGYKLYLTTNPIFPSIATQKRMKWAGLNKDDFEIVTTYEDFYHTKPNTAYYQEVIDRCGLDIHECMMVGNDVKEDGVAETMGIPVYLVDDCLLNKYNLDINTSYLGSSLKFLEFVKQLPEIK